MEREQYRRAQNVSNGQLQHRLNYSNLPLPYLKRKITTAHLDTGPDTDGFRVARSLCAKLIAGRLTFPWLYLWSEGSGTYKSMLACLTLLEAIKAGSDGLYVSYYSFLRELRGTYAREAEESENVFMDRHINAPLLVIDEFGAGRLSQATADAFTDLLDERYKRDSAAKPGHRWTIFTSNWSIEQFVARLATLDDPLTATRIERRLTEMTTGGVVPVLG